MQRFSHEADIQHSDFHKNVTLYHIGQRIMLSWRPTALHSLRLDWAETVNTLQSTLQEVHQIPPSHSWDLTCFTPRWLHHKNVFVHQVLSWFKENVSKTRYLLFKLLNSFRIWCLQHRFANRCILFLRFTRRPNFFGVGVVKASKEKWLVTPECDEEKKPPSVPSVKINGLFDST